jgi:nitrile hydratase
MTSEKEHNHHHSHDHKHEDAHSHLPSDPELRVKAIETLLLRKGLIDSETLDELIDTYENKIGPQNGAKVVAKAWVDESYKKRLLADATAASDEYRSRTVREPRKVLSEFGVNVDPKVKVKVWDSTAELRYLVLPMRPKGTEHLNESELAELVTRNSMIGTGLPENAK